MLRLKAYAKINLSLKILGKRPDNFHELESVMQSVSLADIITLEPSAEGIVLTTNNSRLPDDNRNLAYRAAEAFLKVISSKQQEVRNKGIKIHIEKNIPIAAGLAGGSTDAAAVLYGLNQLTINNSSRSPNRDPDFPQYKLMSSGQLTIKELLEMGAEIGSDVPFCLTGGRCLVRGRGEVISSKKQVVSNKNDFYVLVVPEVEVSTKWAYDVFDVMSNDQLPMTNEGNSLEAVVIKKYPVIQKVKDRLLKLGCERAQMSGSGPSVFGTVKNETAGKTIVAEMKKRFSRSFLVHSVERGIEEF